MTSILTNTAAMAALQTLRSIDRSMTSTQARVSSGLEVGTAADNAAYWSIATTMRSDNGALASVADALGLGASKVDTAYIAMESVVEIMGEIKKKLVAAREPGLDRTKIDDELTELKNQLASAAQAASFSGENWLYNDQAAPLGVKSVVSSFVRTAGGTVTVAMMNFDTAASVLVDTVDPSRGFLTRATDADALQQAPTGTARNYHLLAAAGGAPAGSTEIRIDGTTTDAAIDDMVSVADALEKQLTNAASTLGAISHRIAMQESFVATLGDVIDKGIGRLVDADMNEESTRLKALQTQQQLAIQSLSIANSSAEGIIQLFRQ